MHWRQNAKLPGRGRFCSRGCSNRSRRSSEADSFWPLIKRSATCWLWQGTTNGRYGTVHVNGEHFYAHRYSFQLHRGTIPDGMMVLHHCDNPLCVNPNHLHLGTQTDNMREASERGRLCVGERNHFAKRSVEDVRVIRESAAAGESYSSIARRLGGDAGIISLIVRRKIWRSV